MLEVWRHHNEYLWQIGWFETAAQCFALKFLGEIEDICSTWRPRSKCTTFYQHSRAVSRWSWIARQSWKYGDTTTNIFDKWDGLKQCFVLCSKSNRSTTTACYFTNFCDLISDVISKTTLRRNFLYVHKLLTTSQPFLLHFQALLFKIEYPTVLLWDEIRLRNTLRYFTALTKSCHRLDERIKHIISFVFDTTLSIFSCT